MADMLRATRDKLRRILDPRATNSASDTDSENGQQSSLEATLETYKHAFETTQADRDRLAAELEIYKHAFETTEADRDRLSAELEAYGRAAETVAEERDRLAEELETYRQAFESTATDRDFHQQDAIDWKRAVEIFLDSGEFKRMLSRSSPRRDPLPRPHGPGLPNVFCVGVQKSATSFLYSIMRSHPKIDVYPKDTGSIGRLHETGEFTEFAEMIAEVDITRPVIALFDAGFIEYSAAGAETIQKYFCNRPKIIVCIRNPVDRILSQYKMFIRMIRGNGTFVENYDFNDALALEKQHSVEDSKGYFRNYPYTKRSIYSENIDSYITIFGRENVHVIVMEDFIQNCETTLAGVFDFLSLFDEDAFRFSLLSHKKNREDSQSPSEVDVIFHLADGRRLHNPVGMEEVGGGDVVRLEVRSDIPAQLDINRDDPRPELLASAIHLKRRLNYEPSHEEKKRLFNTYFRDDVIRLEKLLGRDLSVWYGHYDD